MPFNKLHPALLDALEVRSIETPTPLQKRSIPIIKSGANVFCIGPKDCGKTTTLILTTLQKLKCEAIENAPRAIVIVKNKSRALELQQSFLGYTKYTSLRVYAGYEELHIDIQKSEIFMGIDILITTPRMIQKLFLQNGVSISQLKILSIADADFLSQRTEYTALISVVESLKKCQFVVYAESFHPQLKRLRDHFMEHAKLVQN
ncbi:DEAD/DEAH box helicase [bacterium]|nr:DEAD/DEAH box helicase [bacterium]